MRGSRCLSKHIYNHSTGRLAEKKLTTADNTKIQRKIFLMTFSVARLI